MKKNNQKKLKKVVKGLNKASKIFLLSGGRPMKKDIIHKIKPKKRERPRKNEKK